MLKKIKFLLILVVGLYVTLPILIAFTQNITLLRAYKNMIPNILKENVKKGFVFFVSEEYSDLISVNRRLEDKLIQLSKQKDLVNSEYLPNTQFQTVSYKEVKINSFEHHSSKLDNERNGKKVIPFYIENYKDKIILFSITGKAIYFDTEDLINKKNPKENMINTNLPQNITLKDFLITQGKIYVSITYREKTCDSIELFVSDFNLEDLQFKKFYSQINEGEPCNGWLKAGRLASYNEKNEQKLLLVAREPDGINHFLNEQQVELQKTHGKFDGSVIYSFDLKTGIKEIISSGHRNPQGLFVNKDNLILLTEHGPRGGDEINKVEKGTNYGWPISSYGENYYKGLSIEEDYRFKKSHEDYGLREPIYAFVPSIGISQIIELPNNFSKKWQNNYLIASMKAGSIYRVTFDKKFERVITWERIRVGKRIRDLQYDKFSNTVFLALEDNKGQIGIIRSN